MTATAVQLDLFAGDPNTRRLVDGLTCLRDAVPDAMDVLINLGAPDGRDVRSIGASGDWAYSLRRDGFHYEHTSEWWRGARARGERYGWDRRPAHLITWDELAAHLRDHPARPEVLAWAAGLPEPSWKQRTRPYELWPNPQRWHPGYIAHDHEQPGWPARLAAWRALQQITTDAITHLETPR